MLTPMPFDPTLGGMMERIIRNLGQPTAGDLLRQQARLAGTHPDPIALTEAKGLPASTVAWLTPELLTQKIQEAISQINVRTLDFAQNSPLTISIPATTQQSGPQQVQLATGFNTANSQIDRVRSAAWQTVGNISYDPLTLKTLQELTEQGYDWRGATPVTPPIYFAIEGYQVYLIPAPSTQGILSLTAVMGLLMPNSINDTMQQLPFDLYTDFECVATALIAETQGNDPVLKAYADSYGARTPGAIKAVADTIGQMSDAYEPSTWVRTGRIPRMRR